MTRRILIFTSGLLLSAALALSADLAGKWSGTIKVPAGRNQPGETREVPVTLDIKTTGGQVTGTLTLTQGRRSQTVEIQDGKVDGNKISFTTTHKGRQAETKFTWEATLQGDELSGERRRESGRRGQPFSLKRM